MSEGKVAKNTAYLVMAFVGQKVLSFLYFTVLARSVGVQGAGRYFIAISFTTIFSIFVDIGLSNVLVREVAKFPDKARTLLANVLGLKVILAACTVIAVSVAAAILNYPLETRLMIAIASAVMVLDSIHLVFYAVMRGYQNLRYEAIGVVIGQLITLVAGGTFLAMRLPLPFLVVALFFGSAWNFVWSWLCVSRRFKVRPSLSFDKTMMAFLWSVTIPFALSGIFSRVYSYIDSIMLSKIVGETAVGFYSVAYKITFAFQFLPMAFAAAMYPAMSKYYVADRQKLNAIFGSSMTYLMLMVTPIAFGISVLAEPIIAKVYGPAYAGSVAPLKILILSLFFAFLYWPAGSLLNACDRQSSNTKAMGATVLVNIILNIFLIPRYGAVGAAIAAFVGNATLFFVALHLTRDVARLDEQRFTKPAVRILFSGVLMSLALTLFLKSVPLLLLIAMGAVVYVGSIFVTKALTMAEAKKLANVFLRRGKGVSDIVSEEI